MFWGHMYLEHIDRYWPCPYSQISCLVSILVCPFRPSLCPYILLACLFVCLIGSHQKRSSSGRYTGPLPPNISSRYFSPAIDMAPVKSCVDKRRLPPRSVTLAPSPRAIPFSLSRAMEKVFSSPSYFSRIASVRTRTISQSVSCRSPKGSAAPASLSARSLNRIPA
jgi:hypothetical protein